MRELYFTRNNARGQIGDETNFKSDVIDLMKRMKHWIKCISVEVVF